MHVNYDIEEVFYSFYIQMYVLNLFLEMKCTPNFSYEQNLIYLNFDVYVCKLILKSTFKLNWIGINWKCGLKIMHFHGLVLSHDNFISNLRCHIVPEKTNTGYIYICCYIYMYVCITYGCVFQFIFFKVFNHNRLVAH